MTNRSSRGSGKPSGSKRFVRVQVIWDLIRGLHQGQRPAVPHQKAGHMAAPDRAAASPISFLHQRGRPHMDPAVLPSFAANAVRLQLHALAYNLGNFMRTLAMPKTADPWSLTSLREKLIKIGAKVVSHGRYVTFQMAEVAVPRQMFAEILSLIARLRAPPPPA